MCLPEKPGRFLLWLRNGLFLWLQEMFFSVKPPAPRGGFIILDQGGVGVEDGPLGKLASVFPGGRHPSDPRTPLPSGPGSASGGGWPPQPEGAAGPPPAQPSAAGPAPRTARAPPPPRTAGDSASPCTPAPGVCKAHGTWFVGLLRGATWASPSPGSLAGALGHSVWDSFVHLGR